jgi:adhesin/invasin
VEVFDQFDNLVTGDNADQVKLAVAGGPGSFANGSITTATVADGVATFNNLVFDTAGNYTLAESANGVLGGYNSSSFHVVAGVANHLVFSVQPGNTTAGLAINPAVKVELLDRYGNLLNSDNSDRVMLDVVSGPGLAIESTWATVKGGVATFSELTIDESGTDYTLQVSLGGQDTVASNSFNVTPGPLSLARSVIGLSSSFILAGNTTTIALQAEDAFGNKETNGGLKVAFGLGSAIGGQGTFSAVTDHGNGQYTAIFNGTLAGKNTIKAYIDGQAVTSTAPSIAVVTGPLSLAKSTVTLSSKSMTAGATVTVTLQPEDAGGNKLNLGNGQTILFSLASGQGKFGSVIANKNGTYSATFATNTAGSYTIETTMNGQAVTSTAPTLTVTPAAVSLTNSVLNVSQGSVQKGSQVTVTLKAVDAYGNLETGGLAAAFILLSGKGTFGKVTYVGNGIYQATFTATSAGSVIIEATIAGARFKSTGKITVTP